MPEAGSRGYSDYQRVVNWDSPPLSEKPNAELLEKKELPSIGLAYEVSRYANIAGRLRGRVEGALITAKFIWGSSGAVAPPFAERTIILSGDITGSMLFRLPHLGPYMRAVIESLTGYPAHYDIILFNTNRMAPVEVLPETAIILRRGSTEILKGEPLTVYPTTYFAGPAELTASTSGEEGVPSVTVEVPTLAGTWVELNSYRFASLRVAQHIILPLGAFRIKLGHSGVAPQFMAAQIIPSTTGST
jgi:hypothetical protein